LIEGSGDIIAAFDSGIARFWTGTMIESKTSGAEATAPSVPNG
jgi:hypothetical protein